MCKFGNENKCWFDPIPDELKILTIAESLLIS
jgi:hypothetical protein